MSRSGIRLCINQIVAARPATAETGPPRHRRDASSMAWRCGSLSMHRDSLCGMTRLYGSTSLRLIIVCDERCGPPQVRTMRSGRVPWITVVGRTRSWRTFSFQTTRSASYSAAV